MANAFCSSSLISFNEIQGGYCALRGGEKEDWVEQDHFFGFLPSQYGFHQEKMIHFSQDYQQPWLDYGMPNNSHHGGIPLPLQPIPETTEIGEANKEQPYPFSVTPFELLSNYGGNPNKAREANTNNLSNQAHLDGGKLSTEQIMRVAGERYIQFSTERDGHLSTFIHPYAFSLLGLSVEETRDVDLAQLLLSAAENVSYQQFEHANRLLDHCESMASDTGNPVQRVIYYFSEALRERIERETGKFTIKRAEERGIYGKSLVLGPSLAFLAHHQHIPFSLAIQCAGMQAIVENVVSSPKVHLIDLQIRNGTHWTILMQALAERDKLKCPIELLKITAVGTTNKQEMEGTCNRLESFATSLNLPFSFKIVFLSDMKDIKSDLLDIESDEIVAVYSPTLLRSMISRPDCLEHLMRVIKGLQPAVMVVNEVEAHYNIPSFNKRFIEALFTYSAYFDCFEDCMERDDKYRMMLEGVYFRDGILNIVAAEGEERLERSVRIEVWRAFFDRFRMVEVELSESALYQARLVVNQFACGDSCTLEKNGKCLFVGWKGTPLHSLSTWKFT